MSYHPSVDFVLSFVRERFGLWQVELNPDIAYPHANTSQAISAQA